MNTTKHPMAALLLSFIPGLGHLYRGRIIKGMIYGILFFGLALLSFLSAVIFRETELGILLCLGGIAVGLINLADMIVSLLTSSHPTRPPSSYPGRVYSEEGPQSFQSPHANEGRTHASQDYPPAAANDRYFTVFLSWIPGLGHFHLGLMQRGLAFMAVFFGFIVMTLFLAALTGQDDFFVFLGVLPIVWLYCLFDCVQLLKRREAGEPLPDRTFFDDFQEWRGPGRKNRTLAAILSVFPGAGHMYLGLQKRGFQLMAGFLLAVYILDVLRLSLFMFLIPLLWFFSFFDALQHISRWEKEELRDIPVVEWILHHQRWIGIGLLGLGIYYLFDQVLLQVLDLWVTPETQQRIVYWFERYFQTFVVPVLLIGGGIRLLLGSRGNGQGRRM
ncbi:hypothetical protein ACVNS2_00150 [Paenibacillus caseinilyticus]|uniref:Multi-TM2 domain-containing protein n=1 Tax=Paenibacillus mucilaginosus K02 TaxID=997761 RepID=I0B9V3_9BACL|nr:hypothetical protein [Paenibacillus mucilaginosus]AFH59150.1 multi-TM2 domain-containing protein [Paenibacillus mucilaginosus K02]